MLLTPDMFRQAEAFHIFYSIEGKHLNVIVNNSVARLTSAILTKVVDQYNVKALHDDAGRDQNTPCDSLGIQLDALHEGHVLLLVCSRARMVDHIRMCLAWIGFMSLWDSSRDLFVRHIRVRPRPVDCECKEEKEREKVDAGKRFLRIWGKMENFKGGPNILI